MEVVPQLPLLELAHAELVELLFTKFGEGGDLRVARSMRRNGNRDADRRTSVMPAATNLGSYSDKSNFFSRPASVCGCFAPPPPTLPPKIPHDAGPPSSPQEMSNMLSTGILCQRWRAVRWCDCAASERMGRDRCDALRGAEAARLLRGAWMLPQILPVVESRHPHEGRASPVLAGAVQALFQERW